jgi:uncharacterized protein (TIGR02271 family)
LDRSTGKALPAVVVDANGLEGTIIADRSLSTHTGNTGAADMGQQLLVRFQNGEQVLVPRSLLIQQADGRYRLMASIEELVAKHGSLARTEANEEQTLVVPVTEENVTVQKRVIEKGRVEIHKRVDERTELVDQPLRIEQVEIERVAINRVIDEPVSIRHEGNTTIIPLLEEVLVVEKRLMLREEVHIKKLQTTVHDPQEVRLRAERVEIVRKPGDDYRSGQDEAQQE